MTKAKQGATPENENAPDTKKDDVAAQATPETKPDETAKVEETSKRYVVAAGVKWVNGKKVTEGDTVELSEAEAAYDRGLGRISAVI